MIKRKKRKKKNQRKNKSSSSDDQIKTKRKNSNSTLPPTKKTKTETTDNTSSGLAPGLCLSKWLGLCSYSKSSNSFAFQMDILQIEGKKFSGTIQWPSLNNAKTKFRGTKQNDIIKFEEYEALTGADDVQLPSTYEGKLNSAGTMISGQVTTEQDDDSDDSSSASLEIPSFHLDRIEVTAPKKDISSSSSSSDDTFLPGKKIVGSIIIEQSFNLHIKKKKGDTFEGTIKWPTYTSKFKGKVQNDTMNLDEYEIVKQKVPDEKIILPRFYKSKVDKKNNLIAGDFGPNVNQTQGTFTMKI